MSVWTVECKSINKIWRYREFRKIVIQIKCKTTLASNWKLFKDIERDVG